jgi:3-hydroxyisobutyrate dehydrogenase-like beta-hydroxyacid dehydrogenase
LPIADKERASASLARAGIALLDCPISGTARRLKEGAWTMFISGDAKACKAVAPILAVFTRNAPYVGAFGNGSKMKFIANHLVAIYNVSVGESMTFARRMGLDAQQVWDLFAPSPIIGTGVYRLRGKFMVDRKYLPATMKVEVWQKDMQVIGDMARAVDCPVPLFSACQPIYNAAMAQGLAQHDTASVCEVLDRMAGGGRSRRRVRAKG